MEDAEFLLDNNMSEPLSDSALDFDFMDELLEGGCWLETTTNYSNFLQPDVSTSTVPLDSSFVLPSDTNNRISNKIPSPKNTQHDTEKSDLSYNPSSIETQTVTVIGTQSIDKNPIETSPCSGQLECYLADGNDLGEFETFNQSTEFNGRWWIEPRGNMGPILSVKERLIQAVKYIKDCTEDNVLIQIWVPIRRDNRRVLTTRNQPFLLDTNCQRLVSYRRVSMDYQFPIEVDSNEGVGMPGRVFLGKVPEWTPDVRYFRSDEFPRVNYAQRIDVRGTLALPVFEDSSRSCLGVVEVVTTTQKINYHSDLENICKALQAVNLRSSEVLSIPQVKTINDSSYQSALPEISEVLRAVCETHRLPLAQTWIPCFQQGKKGSRHSDENYTNCVSTVDSACYVTDPCVWGFHEACSEHHLFRGQGVAGKAFNTNQPSFSADITLFSKTEYPLSHHARMFGLRGAVAIRFRSIYTGITDYVLELFLPVDCRDRQEQTLILNSLSLIIQRVCRSLRVVTDKELKEETTLRGGDLPKSLACEDVKIITDKIPEVGIAPSIEYSGEESSWIASVMEARRKEKDNAPSSSKPLEFENQDLTGFDVISCLDNSNMALPVGEIFSEFKQLQQDSTKDDIDIRGSLLGEHSSSSVNKAIQKRWTKMEKTISMDVLRKHFAGSLKDAAKNIGVCPTTLKRICRHHGITRWPSRKIKKVGHSLEKLQKVMDSVKGAEGAFQISSLYVNFPNTQGSDLTSQIFSASSNTLKHRKHRKRLNTQPKEEVFAPHASTSNSLSSSSQSSSSSLCCLSGAQQSHTTVVVSEDASMDNNGMMKRAHSEAKIMALSREEQRLPARSQSHKCLEGPYPSPKINQSTTHVGSESGLFRMKVMYGDEKVRFRLQPSWGFQDLQQEIAKRFHIEEVGAMELKYLDDDSEWVLLTCNADLEECKDIYRSSCGSAIKLSVHYFCPTNTGNFVRSRGLS